MNYTVRRLIQSMVAQRQATGAGGLWKHENSCCRRVFSTSHSGSSTTLIELQPDSNRSKFKDMPVNPSILKYIENIGVGKPERNNTKRRRRNRTQLKSQFLSSKEEHEELRPVRRAPSKTPPPPFAAPSTNTHNDKTERGKIIKRLPVKVIGSIGSQEDDFPRGSKGISEVAIAGRSNVGKSTLLNALLYGNASPENKEDSLPFRKRNRATSRTARLAKGLKAVTSSKPGQTRTLEFYQLSSIVNMDKVSLMLVDLPGYGFAYATEEKMEGWRSLMQDYILRRGKPLKRVLLLIDSRHGMKKADIEFMSELQGALYENNKEIVGERSTKKRELPPIQVVLTKCDLVKQADLARRVTLVREQLSDCLVRQPSALPVMLTSAQMEGQAGVLELQKELASLVPHKKNYRI